MSQEKSHLSPKDRLLLIDTLNGLLSSQFSALETAISVPPGVMPAHEACLATRTATLLQWLEGSSGPGLRPLLEILSHMGIEVFNCSQEETTERTGRLKVKLEGSFNTLHERKIREILLEFQKIADDFSIEFDSIKSGSIEIELQGCAESLERIRALLDNGKVTRVAGMDIESYSSVERIGSTKGLNLRSANLSSINLSGSDLSFADLREANLGGSDLMFANLSSANLSSANLSGATLTRANLSSANLSGANLRSANLTRSNLSGANLSGATLIQANLKGVNLSNATFIHADLSAANLHEVNLSGIDLREAEVNQTQFREVRGLLKSEKQSLITRGAIFDQPNLKVSSLVSRLNRFSNKLNRLLINRINRLQRISERNTLTATFVAILSTLIAVLHLVLISLYLSIFRPMHLLINRVNGLPKESKRNIFIAILFLALISSLLVYFKPAYLAYLVVLVATLGTVLATISNRDD